MKKLLLLLIAVPAMGLYGCGGSTGAQGPQGIQGNTGTQGATGSPGVSATPCPLPSPSPSVDPTTAAISAEVARFNEQQVFNGADPITPGLTCRLWTINNIPAINSVAAFNAYESSNTPANAATYVASYLYQGTFDQANSATSTGFNILPNSANDNLRSQYENYFILKCYGYYVVTQPGFYDMSLTSDDGAILQIGGATLNNDGQHAVTTVSNTFNLSEGVQYFEMDYYEYNGNQALQLYLNGSAVPAEYFYH